MNTSKFVLVCMLAVVLSACSDNKKDSAPPAPKAALVTVTEAKLMDVPSTLTAVGIVAPDATVTIVSRVAGELMEIHVDEGEYVKKGQLLFVIDKRQMEITLKQVQAQLDSDKAKLVKAEDDLARSQKLTSGGFTSAAQNDEARVAAVGYRAAVKADEAAVEQAMLNLSYSEIRAPMAGRAGVIKVDKGNLIPAQSLPLLTIDAIQPVTVTFSVPERHLLAVRGMAEGSNLLVTAQPKLGEPAEGTLTFVGNVDSTTGTVPLKATFPNESSLMWPGEFVRIKLQLAILKDSVTVPSRAVIIGPDGTFVYVVSENMKAHYRLVSTGVETEGITIITKGLEAGERVVMEGHVRLFDGVTVRLPEPTPPAPEAPATAEGDGAAS